MAEPDRYGAAARKIVQESRAARDAYIAHCKTLTPKAFLQEPPERLRRLSLDEYLGIIRTILGQPASAPIAAEPPKQAVPATSHARRLCEVWRKISPARKAAIIAVSISAAVAAGPRMLDMVATQERPTATGTMDVERWHPCRRLDPRQDRCIYRTQRALYWEYVAAQLAQDVSLLRRNNRHLQGQHVPARAAVIVFRPSPTR